jgi:uncharacterized membrane protein
MKTSAELRSLARGQLKGCWLTGVGLCLLCSLIIGVSSIFAGIGPFIVGGPLCLGLSGYFIKRVRGEQALVSSLFDGFNESFGRAILLNLFLVIFILLWSLLLFIPGIVKGFSYSMAYYILRDNPGMNALDAITASKKMMAGHKWRLFCLNFSFIGWALLCALSFGIGFLWLQPYMAQSVANFYEDLRGRGLAGQGLIEAAPAG